MDSDRWVPLGELLVEQSLISKSQLEAALDAQLRTGRPLGEIVVESGAITLEQLTTVLLEQCGLDPSTQGGFGSGLRDELIRRAAGQRTEPTRYVYAEEEQPAPERRRRFRRKGDRASKRHVDRGTLERLERLVQEFEDEQRELVANLGALKRLLQEEAAA